MAIPDTWILVCDGSHAKLFVNHGPQDGIREKAGVSQILPSRTSSMLSNGRGRGKAPAGSQRHAYVANDPRRLVKELFLKGIADAINKHVGDLERLIIIAPPRALHVLRENFSQQVRAKIIGEIDKDLIHNDARTLPQFLKDYMKLRDPLHDFQAPPGNTVRNHLYKQKRII